MSQPTIARTVAAVLCFALHCSLGVWNAQRTFADDPASSRSKADTEPPKQPNKDRIPQLGDIRAGRILFLGNSITLHGPAPVIGWLGNWGMAASERGKDYAHVLVNAIAEITGRRPEALIDNIADFERRYDTYDVRSGLKKHLAFKAGLVIVAIGENVPALASEQSRRAFKASLVRLLKTLKADNNPAIVVRSCFWPDKTKDDILKQACAEVGGIFVDIGGLSKDETHFARSERAYAHAGVAGHPGDKGMKAIADAILKALTR
jgi:hypothetical protein